MKMILVLLAMITSITAMAAGQEVYIKNTVDDDEGVKIVYSNKAEPTRAEIKTVYVRTSQANFASTRQALITAKDLKAKVIISNDTLTNKLTVTPAVK